MSVQSIGVNPYSAEVRCCSGYVWRVDQPRPAPALRVTESAQLGLRRNSFEYRVL
jgi:hypothetical protein